MTTELRVREVGTELKRLEGIVSEALGCWQLAHETGDPATIAEACALVDDARRRRDATERAYDVALGWWLAGAN